MGNKKINVSTNLGFRTYLPQQVAPNRKVTSLSIAPAYKLQNHQSGTVCLRGQTYGLAIHPDSATSQNQFRISGKQEIRNITDGFTCLH